MMPHIVLEHSKHLSDNIEITELLNDLHKDLAGRETVDIRYIKTYSTSVEYCQVGADDMQDNMIHIILKLLPNRPPQLKKEMASGLHAIVLSYTDKFFEPWAVSVEIQEIEAETYCV